MRSFIAFLMFLTLTACSITPPLPQTVDEAVDVQYGFISVMYAAAYSRYYNCRENAESDFKRQACIDEARDADSVLTKAEQSLASVDAIEDLDDSQLRALRVLRAALAPHFVAGDRATLEVLDQ